MTATIIVPADLGGQARRISIDQKDASETRRPAEGVQQVPMSPRSIVTEFEGDVNYAAVCILVRSGLHESLHSLRAVLGRYSVTGAVSRKEAFHVSFGSPRGCSFDACTCGR